MRHARRTLMRRAVAAGVPDKIRVLCRDMSDLRTEKKDFDLIWSEGALYSMGFREGLIMCQDLLTPGGLMAVSELCWLHPDPPETCHKFFTEEYPPMVDTGTNVDMIKQLGYELLGRFSLPDSAWLEGYYVPLEERLKFMRREYAAEPEKVDLIEAIQVEIDMYRQYGRYYGYDFYLMQLP